MRAAVDRGSSIFRATCRPGQFGDAARYLGRRILEYDRDPRVVGAVEGLGVVGDKMDQFLAERLFRFHHRKLVGQPTAVHDQADARTWYFQILEMLQDTAGVPQRGEVQTEYQEDSGSLAQRHNLLFVKTIFQVHDDVGKELAGHGQGLVDPLYRNHAGVAERLRRSQQMNATGMPDQHLFKHGPVQARDILTEIGEIELRFQIEQGGQVADSWFQVKQGAFLVFLGQHDRNIHGQGAGAAAAAGGQQSQQ